MKNRLLILYVCLVSILSSCKKKNSEVEPVESNVYRKDLAGIYEGKTHEIISNANQKNGYSSIDTNYTDQVKVDYVGLDSLYFTRAGRHYKFKLDTVDLYIKWIGDHTTISFKFQNNNGLKYYCSTKQWLTDSLHMQTTDFSGYKK